MSLLTKQVLTCAAALAVYAAYVAPVTVASQPDHMPIEACQTDTECEQACAADYECAMRDAVCRQDGQDDVESIQLNIEFDCYAMAVE